MRFSIFLLGVCMVFSACTKDKYTSAPQIKYKSVNPSFIDTSSLTNSITSTITFSITDAEGDIGITDKDTAFVYIKNLHTQVFDSLPFPDISAVSKSRFKADILTDIGKVVQCANGNGAGRIDTLYFELYVKDFAKNQSNTIVTTDPVFEYCQ